MKKIIVIDGNSIMYRAFYATYAEENTMKSSNGIYTNAIYGFINMMQYIRKNFQGDHIFVGFDKGKKTFRHQHYGEYKGGRKKTPDALIMQIPYIKEYLDLVNITRLELDEYEADDIVGTVARLAKNDFDEVMVITGDRDLLQLVEGNIHVYLTKKGLKDLDCYTEENFYDKAGFYPTQLTDYKGLVGDSSDNLPGIAGVGNLTAIKLLNKYQTLEGIVEHASELTPKLKQNVLEYQEVAMKSKLLAKLYTDIELPFTIEDTIIKEPNYPLLKQFYQKFEFNVFLNRINNIISSNEAVEQIITESIENEVRELKFNDVNGLINAINKSSLCYIDAEIAGENYHKDQFLGASFIVNNELFFIDQFSFKNGDLIDCLNQTNINFYCYDSKKTYCALSYQGITLKHIGYDFCLATYIINPAYCSNEPVNMFEKFTEINIPAIEQIYKRKTKYQVPELSVYGKYSSDKLVLVEKTFTQLNNLLNEASQSDLLYKMELPLAVTLGKMELHGFRVKKSRLVEIGEELNKKMKVLETQIYELAGEEFNLSSPKQLGVILFEKLAIAKGVKNKIGYNTSADVLEKLSHVHPLPKLILEYRKYAKLSSTYVTSLINEISSVDYNVHTIFKQYLTLTGRLSSTEPNIQNIPIRTEDGRLIRSAFVSRFEGGELISADYSQIELRVLAHMAKVQNMIDAFNNGIDLHASTASKIFGVDINSVTKEMRRLAKAVNFGIIYGMGAHTLGEDTNISFYEAKEFINKYYQVYPAIKSYLDDVVQKAKHDNYTQTLFNRRRYMDEINSSNRIIAGFAERTAKNAPIQGTAADIIKLAMVKVDERIQRENLKAILVAQVHDELIIDSPSDEVEKIKTILKEEMENVVSLDVQLNADVNSGKSWDLK